MKVIPQLQYLSFLVYLDFKGIDFLSMDSDSVDYDGQLDYLVRRHFEDELKISRNIIIPLLSKIYDDDDLVYLQSLPTKSRAV